MLINSCWTPKVVLGDGLQDKKKLAQLCGRRTITTAHIPWRVATPSRDDPADLDSIRGSSRGPVCFPRGAGPAGRAALAHPDLVSRNNFPCDSTSLAHSSEEGPLLSGARHHMAPASRSVEPPCVAPGRDASDLSGLPPVVVETIAQARAPSTSQTYALKWSLFANWCSSRRDKFLSAKTALLTALRSIKRVGDLQAFSDKLRVPCVRAGLLSRCLETPAWIRAQGSQHALPRSGGEPPWGWGLTPIGVLPPRQHLQSCGLGATEHFS